MNIPNKNENKILSHDCDKSSKKSAKPKSFYIALSICTAALSAAAWSTYESVKKFMVKPHSEPKVQTASQSVNKKSDKNAILEQTPEEKSELKHRTPIPFESPPINHENIFEPAEQLEEIQAVSASKIRNAVVYPVGNDITKEFSDGKPIYSNTMSDWRAHDGADFKAEIGTAVESITSGTVRDVYNDPCYGNTVVIDHDSQFAAYYSGLDSSEFVQKGQQVQPGQKIGKLGKVPCEIADEPHLHLAISQNDKFIDPLLVLDKER